MVALKLIKVSENTRGGHSGLTLYAVAVQIFDMENEQQRDNCLKEVQLHQVGTGALPLGAGAF